MKTILLTLMVLMLVTVIPVHAYQVNTTVDFNVQGQDQNGGSIYGTPSSTILAENGTRIMFAAYSYENWAGAMPGGATLIYLVNVTATNFLIAWLYIPTVAESTFFLYIFNYTAGSSFWLRFIGEASASSTLVQVPLASVPSLQIVAEPKVVNRIFVNSPNITMAGDSGLFYGEPAYALANLMNVSSTWNELWLLTVGPQGYGFVMLYTYFNDPTHVVAGQTLNLNDYSYTDYQSGPSPASWITMSKSEPVPEFQNSLILLPALAVALIVARKKAT